MKTLFILIAFTSNFAFASNSVSLTECEKLVKRAAEGVIEAQLGERDKLDSDIFINKVGENMYSASGTGESRYTVSLKITVNILDSQYCNLKKIEITDLNF